MGAGLFSHVASDRMRGNGLEFHQRRLRLDIRKNSFTKRIVKYWTRLCWGMVESLSMEIFNLHVDVALRNKV